ncbi:M48 family metallopeptidase [Celeribacter baekdonensis]|uniref:Peptidase M48 Ste24p n=1 Tax=Celeribacter baekdonensis TaxID=875171 RepID=A0A2R4M4Z0_9RHOB|nr:M48 family metallopeptidase [Celeribacter baekdonensis]AVW92235.1 peptidase M48 Ste24p [Celeribacter baekdonensis]
MTGAVRSPWGPIPEGVLCDFVDGESAHRHEVYVQVRSNEAGVSLSYTDDTGQVQTWTWPLSHLRYVEGQTKLRWGPARLGVFTNVMTPTARLYVRDTVLLHEIEARAPSLRRRAPATGRGRLMGLIAGAIASVALIVFFLIPLIADQLATLLPIEGERALGEKAYQQVREAFSGGFVPLGECENEQGLAALEQMETKLLAASTLASDAVQLTVLDFDMVNAFALPGGRIVVMRGLIDAAESPDEVAAVIAHEMGHVDHRDPTRHALRSVGTFGVLSLVFGDFAGGTMVLMGANQLVNAQYSQAAESAADSYAHEMLPRAGISPGALAPLFERLKAEYGDSEGLASHLASHPQLGDRVTRAQAAAESYVDDGVPFMSNMAWQRLRQICD